MGSRGEDRSRQQNQIAAWWSASRTSDRNCRSWAERGLVRRWCGGRSQQDASRIRSKQFRSESSYLLLVGETGFEGVKLHLHKSATAHPFSGQATDCRQVFQRRRVHASPPVSGGIHPGRGDIVETLHAG